MTPSKIVVSRPPVVSSQKDIFIPGGVPQGGFALPQARDGSFVNDYQTLAYHKQRL